MVQNLYNPVVCLLYECQYPQGKLWTLSLMNHHSSIFQTVVSDGLESSQFCSYTHDGLEMSQFTMSAPNGLERSHLWVVIFSLGLGLWPFTVVCRVQMVMFQLRGLKVPCWKSLVNVSGSDESWFRLVSLPAFGWGVLWAGLNRWLCGWKWCWGWAWWWSRWVALWGWLMLGVSMMVKLGVFDVCLVHQTSWTLVSI